MRTYPADGARKRDLLADQLNGLAVMTGSDQSHIALAVCLCRTLLGARRAAVTHMVGQKQLQVCLSGLPYPVCLRMYHHTRCKDVYKRQAVEGSNFEIPVDAVIMAIGTKMDSIVTSTTENLATDKYGCITTSDDASTSRAGVFAGGDDVTGPLTVVKAMKAGRIAAASMDEYMNK